MVCALKACLEHALLPVMMADGISRVGMHKGDLRSRGSTRAEMDVVTGRAEVILVIC